jgi:multiple sugar transport system substrate-binding protein
MPERHVRWTAVLGAIVLLAGVGCGGSSGGGGGGNITLTETDYYTADPALTPINTILHQCAKQVGVTLKPNHLERNQMMQKVLQEAPSHSLPNLLMVDNPDLQQVASTGALEPLSKFGFRPSGYYSSILSAGSYKGKVYALSQGVNSIALFYNKDLLTAANIASPPQTWDQLTADAKALTHGSTYGFAFSAPATEEGTWQFEPFFWSNGASFNHVNSPQAVQALQLWTSLVQSGSAPKDVVTWTQADLANNFAAGHLAMVINGPWNFNVFKEASSTNNLHWAVAPIPVPKAGGKDVVPLGGEVWTVPVAKPAVEQKAWQVLSCMQQPANMLTWDRVGYVSPKPAVASQLAQQMPEIAPFVQEIPTARARTAQLGTKYPKVSEALWNAVQSALIGRQSPQDALNQAQQTVDQVLSGG